MTRPFIVAVAAAVLVAPALAQDKPAAGSSTPPSAQNPAAAEDTAPDFTDVSVTIGAAQKDPDTDSSKFLEYRDIPQGGVLPYFASRGKKGDFRWALVAKDVTQKDQTYFVSFEKPSWKLSGDYVGVPHNFGNGGRSLLSPVEENVWRLSDTTQASYQSAIVAVPAQNRGGQIDYNCQPRFGFTPAAGCFSLAALVAPGLDATPQNIDLKLTRGRSNLAFNLTPAESAFSVGVTYFHERRSGTRAANGTSFGFGNVVETPEPLRYITQDVGVNASWNASFGTLRAGVRFNTFDNKLETFTWDNPFRVTDSSDPNAYQAPSTASRNGAADALMALMPDNQATTEMIGGTFKFGSRTRLTADLTLGQWRQNETPFVPWTTNDNLLEADGVTPWPNPPLPAAALDGKIDTTALNGFLTSGIGPVGVHARYRYYDNDNQTPRYRLDLGYARYDAVWEDIPRITVPYGYGSDMFDLYATWGTGMLGFEAGWKYNAIDRTYRETEQTTEKVWRAAVDVRGGWYSARAIGEIGDRDFEHYDAEFAEEQSFLCESGSGLVPCGTGGTVEAPANQTVLRRPDQAARDLTRFGVQAELSPGSGKFNVAASFFHTKFEYDQSPVECEGVSFFPGQEAFCPGGLQAPLGLVDDEYNTLGIDASFTPNDRLNLYAFYQYEDGDILQTGRQSGGTLNFSTNDVFTVNITNKGDTFGAGADFTLVPDRWWLNLFARYQKVDGNNDTVLLPGFSTAIYGGNPALQSCVGQPGECAIPAFDDTKLTYLYGAIRHQLAKSWSVAAFLGFEDYEIDDAQTENTLNYMPASFFLQANNRDYQAWFGFLTLTYTLR
jgi:hypothetical protein